MRTDRRIIKAYLADFGNWLSNPYAAIGYPEEVRLALNIYDTFDAPDIRKVYRDITGKEAPIEADENYLDKEREYREANYIKSKEEKRKRVARFVWFDLHTHMNEINKIVYRLDERLQVIILAIFKDGVDNDRLANRLHISIKTLEGNIAEIYDRVGEEIRASKHYEELFNELYEYDRPRRALQLPTRRRPKRKRQLKVPDNVKPNFSHTLSLR